MNVRGYLISRPHGNSKNLIWANGGPYAYRNYTLNRPGAHLPACTDYIFCGIHHGPASKGIGKYWMLEAISLAAVVPILKTLSDLAGAPYAYRNYNLNWPWTHFPATTVYIFFFNLWWTCIKTNRWRLNIRSSLITSSRANSKNLISPSGGHNGNRKYNLNCPWAHFLLPHYTYFWNSWWTCIKRNRYLLSFRSYLISRRRANSKNLICASGGPYAYRNYNLHWPLAHFPASTVYRFFGIYDEPASKGIVKYWMLEDL